MRLWRNRSFGRAFRRPDIRRSHLQRPAQVKRTLENNFIRFVVLMAVLLAVAQIGLGLAGDPVDSYLALARKVEDPPLDIQPTSGLITPETNDGKALQTWKIALKAIPAAPVRVLQNGKLLGTLSKGQLEISVQAGTLQLDGTACPQIVRIQVIGRDNKLQEPRLNQTLSLEKNIQTLRVTP